MLCILKSDGRFGGGVGRICMCTYYKLPESRKRATRTHVTCERTRTHTHHHHHHHHHDTHEHAFKIYRTRLAEWTASTCVCVCMYTDMTTRFHGAAFSLCVLPCRTCVGQILNRPIKFANCSLDTALLTMSIVPLGQGPPTLLCHARGHTQRP